jgi:hypothetical protein
MGRQPSKRTGLYPAKGLNHCPFQVQYKCPRPSAKTAPAQRCRADVIPSAMSARRHISRTGDCRSAGGQNVLSGGRSGNCSASGNNPFSGKIDKVFLLWRNHENYLTLQGLRPAARRPVCDSAVLPVKKAREVSGKVIPRHRMRPRPRRGQGWRKGDNQSI